MLSTRFLRGYTAIGSTEGTLQYIIIQCARASVYIGRHDNAAGNSRRRGPYSVTNGFPCDVTPPNTDVYYIYLQGDSLSTLAPFFSVDNAVVRIIEMIHTTIIEECSIYRDILYKLN